MAGKETLCVWKWLQFPDNFDYWTSQAEKVAVERLAVELRESVIGFGPYADGELERDLYAELMDLAVAKVDFSALARALRD